MLLDPVTLKVSIAGPVLDEELPSWARWRKIRATVDAEYKELKGIVREFELGDCEETFIRLIAIAKETLDGIDRLRGSRSVMQYLKKLDMSHIELRCGKNEGAACVTFFRHV